MSNIIKFPERKKVMTLEQFNDILDKLHKINKDNRIYAKKEKR